MPQHGIDVLGRRIGNKKLRVPLEPDAKGGFLLDTIGRIKDPGEEGPLYLLMDRAYEDGETRLLAFEWGYSPGEPPKKNRKHPWDYNKEVYKQRNEVERWIFFIFFSKIT